MHDSCERLLCVAIGEAADGSGESGESVATGGDSGESPTHSESPSSD